MEYPEYRWEPRAAVSVVKGGGPERTKEEDPPEDWTPPDPVGFAPPRAPVGPCKTWPTPSWCQQPCPTSICQPAPVRPGRHRAES